MDAKDSYIKRQAEINNEIKVLKEKIKNHNKEFAKHTENWGYVGNLTHILKLLKELNSFLKS